MSETSPSNAAETPAGGQPPAEPSPPKDTPYEDESEGEGEEDDNETCGFCIFMKGGGCKEAFVAWSDCVDKEREAGGDFTEECKDATLRLRECMLAHRDYYAPLLEEEEAEMEAARQAAAAAAAAAAATEGDSPPPAPQGEGDGVVSPGGDSS